MENDLMRFKPLFVFFISGLSIVVSSIFWVQNYSENHFYSITSGAHLEAEINDLNEELKYVRKQNEEMILMLGRIEGMLEND